MSVPSVTVGVDGRSRPPGLWVSSCDRRDQASTRLLPCLLRVHVLVARDEDDHTETAVSELRREDLTGDRFRSQADGPGRSGRSVRSDRDQEAEEGTED